MTLGKLVLHHLTHTQVPTMTPDQYVQQAMRTQCPQEEIVFRIAKVGPNYQGQKLQHSIIGLAGEVGELAGAWERHIYYGQDLDVPNLKEEVGDCLWYLAELCDAMGFSMSEIMEGNIRKLQKRFPDKFKEDLAKEENRNRLLEMEEMLSTEHLYDKASQDAELRYMNNKNRAADDGVNYDADSTN